jgi:hypothetical protein
MKRFVLFYFFLLCIALKTRAQNLVPNPSFENYYNCGNLYINNAVDWEMLNNNAGTGLLLTCQSDSYGRTPRQYLDACFQSYQTVRTGTAYAEFAVYTQNVASQESGHPACKLIDTLKAGKIYCVTYYVSMWNNARYSIDKLGALLTATPFPYYVTGTSTPTFSMAGLYTPQVVSTPGVVFEDTLGWEEVSGSYTAVGNEAYLTIGDFFLHSQHLIKNSYPNCNGLAEYYVDDVSVELVEIAKAKNDTLIYAMDSVIIGANNSEAALFNWQPSAGLSCTNCPNPKASPTITTTYTVIKTQCKSVTSDVITITVSPTSINELNVNNAITLQPNPTSGFVNINSKFEMQKIEVINIAGQILLSETVNEKTRQLLLNNFSEGIYFVKIVLENGMTVTKKIIKQ